MSRSRFPLLLSWLPKASWQTLTLSAESRVPWASARGTDEFSPRESRGYLRGQADPSHIHQRFLPKQPAKIGKLRRYQRNEKVTERESVGEETCFWCRMQIQRYTDLSLFTQHACGRFLCLPYYETLVCVHAVYTHECIPTASCVSSSLNGFKSVCVWLFYNLKYFRDITCKCTLYLIFCIDMHELWFFKLNRITIPSNHPAPLWNTNFSQSNQLLVDKITLRLVL